MRPSNFHTHRRRITAPVRAGGRVWALLKVGVFVLAVVVAGWLLLQQTVQSKLAGAVEQKVNVLLTATGTTATVTDAEFIQGQGLVLRDVAIRTATPTSSDRPLLTVDKLLAESHVTLPELVAGQINLRAVRVEGARLRVTRDAAGRWNFQSLLDAIEHLKPAGQEITPVRLNHCEVVLIDHLGGQRDHPKRIEIPRLNVSIVPVAHDGRRLTQINGRFTSTLVKDFQFTAWANPATGLWKVDLDATDIQLSRNAAALLPNDLAAKLLPLRRLEGQVSASGTVSGDLRSSQPPQFDIDGQCKNVVVNDQRLPWELNQIAANFNLSADRFRIDSASGKLGNASFRLNYGQEGWLTRGRWYATGDVKNFNYRPDYRLSAILPVYCGKFANDFSPSGMSNIQFNMAHDGHTLKRNIQTQLTDMSFRYLGMPYQITGCTGVATIVDRNCHFKVRALEGDQPIDIVGSLANMGHGSTFECQINVPGGLPLNEKMFDAMQKQPKLASVIQAFNPTGFASGVGILARRVAGGPVHKSFDIQLKGVNVRHDRFPYPIRNVSGTIQTRDDTHTFNRLVGTNGSSRVDCQGSWNPTAGLIARLQCTDVSLDDQLRVALKPSLREIWQGFRPRGTADLMLVDLRLPIGQDECDVTVEANFRPRNANAVAGFTSIQPTWFPYEIRHLTGKVKIGDGRVELSQFEGQHDRTWIKCDGDGEYSDKDWSVRLKNMLVLSLAVDDDLLAAVPSSLAPQVRNLQYEGTVNAQGEITLAGRYTNEAANMIAPAATVAAGVSSLNQSTFSLAWDVGLEMTAARMMVGVPVENVFGAVKLVGQYDGQNAECQGELDIDSMMIYDNQITGVSGPIWLDNDRAAAGLFASRPALPTQPNQSPNASPVQRDDRTSLSGTLYGGTVHLDAQISADKLGEFYLQSTLEEARLEAACREACPSVKDVSGRTFAALRLAGNCSGTHTYRGDGSVQLRDAKIYELPPALALFKKLRIGRSDRSAFDSSNVNFTISGETFDLNRIELLGDAISLLGNGRMNMDRKIDLNFYSIMGRNRFNIPLISDMVHASSQQAMWIHVNGTVDDPQMTRTVLPQLNDSLRQLFNTSGQAGPQRMADVRASNAAGQRRTRNLPDPGTTTR